ncbi:MAG: hypothetical protein Q9165_007210 [Trypethelium subeluteriae]
MSSPQEPPSNPSSDTSTDTDAKSHFHAHITTLHSLTSSPAPLSLLLTSRPSLAAYTTARTSLPPSILNHVTRAFLYALSHAHSAHPDPPSSSFPSTANTPLAAFLHDSSALVQLYAAAMLHDLGAACSRSGQRFEVDGADAACEVLAASVRGGGGGGDGDGDGGGDSGAGGGDGGTGGGGERPLATEAQRREVWLAIALHTTPHIAERMGGLVGLVRAGVTRDFGAFSVGHTEEEGKDEREERERVEAVFPRLEIEKVLGDAVVGQAVERPGKAPRGTWPGGLLEAWRREPGAEGVNAAF